MKLEGFQELQNDLEKLEKNAKEMEGENTVPFDDLFSYDFMHENTNFDNIWDFFQNAGINIRSQEDFNQLDEMVLDEAVASFTQFKTWEEMAYEAGAEYINKHLFDGLDF